MADPFSAIVAAVTTFFVSAGATAGFAAVAAYAAATFVYAAALFALNSVAKSMLPSGKRGQSLELNYAGTAEPIRYVFGTQKIGGMMVIPPICTGNDGKYLHTVLALCGGGETGIEEIGDVYFDQTVITSASIGAVTGTVLDGLVSSGKFANRAWIRRYLGTQTDLPSGDYILNNAYSAAFNSAFRGRGIAKIFFTNKYSSKVYKGGIPQFTAMVKGCKVYDPRLDSTNGGSGSQRYTDSTTWTWSSNPALCARHYLVKISRRADDIDIDDDSIIAAANVCDQSVNIPGATTQKRWQCNLTIAASDDWRENLKVIIDTMRGRALRKDGKWYLYAGAWDSPTVSINKSDWVSPTVIRASLDKAERWNAVRVFYVDPTRNWQRVQCFPRRNTVYEDADGERIWLDLDLPGVNNEYEAQRHGEITLRQSRNQLMMTGKLRPEFMKLAVWDTVTVNDDEYGFVSKTFRVASMDMSTDGSVTVGLIEEGSALWNDLAAGDYDTQTTTLTLDPGATFPETPINLAAVGERSQINFNWQPGEDELFGQSYEIIESTNSGNASIGTPVWQGIAYNAIVPKTDTTTRWYWVRGVVGSYYSEFEPNTYGVAACASSAPTDGTPGTYAPLLDLRATAQQFRFSGSGTNIGVNTIAFDADLTGIAGTVGFRVSNYRQDGTGIASYDLAGSGNNNRILNVNSFTQNGTTAYAIVTASLGYGVGDSVTDRISVVRLSEGSDGTDGTDGTDAINGYLTNENHTLPASSNGFVPAYTGANGAMVVMRGVNSVSVSSITFSTQSNPQGLTGVFSTNGTFNITGGFDIAETIATVTYRAATFGTNIDKIFTLNKALGGIIGTSGAPAQTLDLLSTAQTFRYSGSATNIGVSTIGFDAILQNITGTAVFYANNYRADNTLLSSYNLGGSGNTNRSLHINSFTQNNSTSYCVVVASISGGFSDRITVIRVQQGASGTDGTDGQNAVVAYLTNEAHTLPASSNGNVTNYDGALGKFMLYEGTTFISDSVNSVTYSINANPQTLTASISNVGSYIVTGGLDVGETSGTLTLRAAYKGTNYDKVFTLGKSLAGNDGSDGNPGGIGPPGSNILSNGLFQYVDSATGLLANWDYGSTVAQSYDNTGGQDGGRCMFIGSHNTDRMYLNGDLIPVDPFNEYLDISVWLRAVNSGHRVYLTMIPYDEFGNEIASHQEQMHTILQPSSGFYNPGATTIRMAKIDISDRGFARKGYQNSFNYINFIGKTTSYFSALDVYWPHSAGIAHSHLITSINSTASTSFDTLTISPALPNTIIEYQDAGLSNIAAYSYQCFPSNTYVTVSSTWTKYTQLYGGETQGYARFLYGNPTTPGNEPNAFRPRTRFVRFGIFSTNDAVESNLYVDDFLVKRRQNIGTPWTNDIDGTLGGGSWIGPILQTEIGSLTNKLGLGIYYSPNSGYSGNGMLISVAADSPGAHKFGMPVR